MSIAMVVVMRVLMGVMMQWPVSVMMGVPSVMVMMPVLTMMVMVVMPLVAAERVGLHQGVQIDGALPGTQGGHAFVEHLHDLGLEAEVAGMGKAHLRVLAGQVLHLAADALDQCAGEQVVRQHDDLHHAQADLVPHHFFQPRKGHAGKGQIDPRMVADLPQPAGHLRHVTIGQPVAGAPAEQHEAGGMWIGHIQREHGLAQQAFEDAQQWIGHAQMRGIAEFHLRMALLCPLDGFRDVVADMAGGVEDQRQHEHTAAGAGRAVDGRVEQRVGKLDEADLDAPVGMQGAPLLGKLQDLGIAGGFTGTVADQQDGVVGSAHHRGGNRSWRKNVAVRTRRV